MASTVADYALIGDCETAALVGRNGSIDWLCWPRFDSPACFASLLGTPANGYWLACPAAKASVTRRYRAHTSILETTFKTNEGQVTLIDFMSARAKKCPRVIRIIRGERGIVRMRMALCLRFGYGRWQPTIEREDSRMVASAGRERLALFSSVPVLRRDGKIVAEFSVQPGDIVSFELASADVSQHETPRSGPRLLKKTEKSWRRWTSRLKYYGPHAAMLERSLITLKALTYTPTGGIVAAPTTSLPETPGGTKNWDYRFCWVRDATFTLLGLIHAGYLYEARAWKEWLLHAAASNPGQLSVLYDVAGRVTHNEWKASWLRGYKGAAPVRVGNFASKQLQLDIFGELADALYQQGMPKAKKRPAFRLLAKLLDRLETIWRHPDHGIWELRGRPRQFTHSKAMCWVAFDRAIRAAEENGFAAPLAKWRAARQKIHESVCRSGFSGRLGGFVQTYGSRQVDASLLLLPLVGFLPPHDPRITGTVRLIEKRLLRRGLVMRREKEKSGKQEGAFLPCSFWLADYYDLAGRKREAKQLLGRLLKLTNDVGLLSEEYSVSRKRLTGNFPQALSHVALVNTVINLHTRIGPSRQRSSPGKSHWAP